MESDVQGTKVCRYNWHNAGSLESDVQGTKVCRYNWHNAGSLGWPFPMLKISLYFSNKIHRSNFIKQHSETVMVWNFWNADCILRKKFYCVIYYNFRHIFIPCRYSCTLSRGGSVCDFPVSLSSLCALVLLVGCMTERASGNSFCNIGFVLEQLEVEHHWLFGESQTLVN